MPKQTSDTSPSCFLQTLRTTVPLHAPAMCSFCTCCPTQPTTNAVHRRTEAGQKNSEHLNDIPRHIIPPVPGPACAYRDYWRCRTLHRDQWHFSATPPPPTSPSPPEVSSPAVP